MSKTKLLAAAAVISGLVAPPVMAKDMTKHSPRRHAPVTHMHKMQQQSANTVGYRGDRGTGFWPADVAGGVVGGAVGIAGVAVNTAGAVATAPFRAWDDSYAYDNSPQTYDGRYAYNDGYPYDSTYAPRDSYAQRNGFVCQPGTWFRGEDGRQHICQ